jgi:outer membrane receptor protein involved in Fe transport
MTSRSRRLYSQLLCGAAMATVLGAAAAAQAEESNFTIPPQALSSALASFSEQTGRPVLYRPEIATSKSSPGASGSLETEVALNQLLAGTGLTFQQDGNTFLIVRASDPQSGSAAGDGAEGTVQALIVTAQKREEDIQDVPIAISAFTQEALERSQVAGGPDLITQVPNMTFTKTNFSSYSIQLRGIGTQAISATTDAAVAVAFNNTPFIRNRFFEQEFYDLQRIEVLRGPQGTLYGRNATAGVVNIITAKPKFDYEAKVSADVANYGSHRIEGMLNIPLVDDKVALRIAGAWTKREGYSTNQITGNPIDGRDLWSTRMSLAFKPTDKINANLIWEHFEENDDRLRSGKQLCNTHEVTSITSIDPGPDPMVLNGRVRVFQNLNHFQVLPEGGQPLLAMGVQGTFSQGCAPASLYSPDSFQTPNGLSLPYYNALGAVSLPIALDDPYVSRTQSHDLRVIESTVDPEYRAKADVVEFQFNFDLTDDLTLTSETAYSRDFVFSKQDYNRFNTASGAWSTTSGLGMQLVNRGVLSPEGVFCDPQIGCADRLVGVDVSTARSRQFSQELRVSSNYEGPFNFSLGANFLRYDTEDKYYVFFNSLSLFSASQNGRQNDRWVPNGTDNINCMPNGLVEPDPRIGYVLGGCQYIDPNPIGSLNDRGHNYFLSKNPYKLISYAVFGESYYQITDKLKLTAGLRWTVDKKEAPRIPSWVIAADTVGYPVAEVVEQEWREPTGRVAIDWKPDLSFTDDTLLYASYAHGYKAGGMNPPAAGLVCYAGCEQYVDQWNSRQAAHPKTFAPEFINAYEVGAKNVLLDGRLTLNTAAFYYDYKGYQLSQIVDRSAISQNFDAKVWGLELEADWRPLENLRLGFKGGYEHTRVADGMKAIDIMDRTAGTPGWVVVSPFPTFPSNCVLPAFLFAGVGGHYNGSSVPDGTPELHNLGNPGGGGPGGCEYAYLFGLDPVTLLPYVPNPTVAEHPQSLPSNPGYPGWDPTLDYGNNHGEGFFKNLGGKELPNAPHFTATITGDYTIPLPNNWLATLHTDLYYQSEAWTRIFNTPGYDKLKAYTNVNIAAIFTNDDAGWKVMAYVKNVLDKDNITGAFLNSDDTGLTTNVFLTEPRLYGLRVTKEWGGGPWWTGANLQHSGPYPLTVELSGQVQRQDAPYQEMRLSWAESVDPALDPTRLQNRDFDWGDGRSLKIVYQPDGSKWSVSAAARYGRTNTDKSWGHKDVTTTRTACAAPLGSYFADLVCVPGSPYYDSYPQFRTATSTEWGDASVRSAEKHEIVDFSVGRDVGMGLLASSTVSADLRYAHFRSTTSMFSASLVDWQITDGWIFLPSSYQRFDSQIDADRQFKGLGPMLSWEAAAHLLGNDESGHLNVAWSVAAGTLFGRQKTRIVGDERATEHTGSLKYHPLPAVGEPDITSHNHDRSRSVSVPVVDLSLGLSYQAGRVNVGTGYRWERYFNVLDAGFDEAKDFDRTLDGPYFKIAVGFGG